MRSLALSGRFWVFVIDDFMIYYEFGRGWWASGSGDFRCK